jgi:pentose-5-phosphate-3-epimerase
MKNSKTSASILSSKKVLYDLKIFESMGIELLHIDWFSENEISERLDEIVDYSSIPLDFHVIGIKQGILNDILKYRPKYCSFQYSENYLPDIIHFCEVLRKSGIQCGVSLCLGENINIIDEGYFDYVMIMNTIPGISGQTLNIEEALRYTSIIRQAYPNLPIHIDGGVDDKTKQRYRGMDIRVFVCGSYLLKSENLYENIFKLKNKEHLLERSVENYIKKGNNFKIHKESTIEQIVEKLNTYKSGFLMVLGEGEKLEGVITDGDIRRKMIDPSADLINAEPVYCNPKETMQQVYEKISKTEKHIQFIPVVSEENRLLGFIDLNKINGEINEY